MGSAETPRNGWAAAGRLLPWALLVLLLIAAILSWAGKPLNFSAAVVWLGALSTLALYSILYKENPIYRFAEHVFLGLAVGYGLYIIWKDVLHPKWLVPLSKGEWPWIFALVAGLMYYTIYSKRLAWMSRVVMTAMMGLVAGLAFRKFFGAYIPQIGASFKPLIVLQPPTGADTGIDPAASLFASFTNILFVVTLLTVLSYFFFSFEQKNRAVKLSANTGRWLMMVAFGAMFGSTVMARMSLFIGRLDFLFGDWIRWIPR